MVEKQKKHGFLNFIKDGLSFISQIVSATVLPQLAEGAEVVMKNIDARILKIEKRIFRKMSSFFVILLGLLFLLFGIFFFLTEYLKWRNYVAFLSLGMIILIAGLLLKLGESDN